MYKNMYCFIMALALASSDSEALLYRPLASSAYGNPDVVEVQPLCNSPLSDKANKGHTSELAVLPNGGGCAIQCYARMSPKDGSSVRCESSESQKSTFSTDFEEELISDKPLCAENSLLSAFIRPANLPRIVDRYGESTDSDSAEYKRGGSASIDNTVQHRSRGTDEQQAKGIILYKPSRKILRARRKVVLNYKREDDSRDKMAQYTQKLDLTSFERLSIHSVHTFSDMKHYKNTSS